MLYVCSGVKGSPPPVKNLPIHSTQCSRTTCIIHSITSNISIIPTVAPKKTTLLTSDTEGCEEESEDSRKSKSRLDSLA